MEDNTYEASDDIRRNKILGKLQEGQAEMPQGQYLKDGKHNAKICKNPFLHILYIYLCLHIVLWYYKYYFKALSFHKHD